MDSPIKPWERNGEIDHTSPSYVPNTNTTRLHSSVIPFPGSGGGVMASASAVPSIGSEIPPPLPPRPAGNSSLSSYDYRSSMPYSSAMSPYGGLGYGSSMYSPYGGIGGMSGMYGGGFGSRMYGYGHGGYGSYGVNNYGPMHGDNNTFAQLAEQSSASAFQSIESFVSAFGSISAMLESTFYALYSSFRAVIGVADHLGRMRQIISTLAIFRFFRWVYRRILYLIGISKIKPGHIESLWNDIAKSTDESSAEYLVKPNSKPSSWPVLMFLGFIFAGPYLMWKLVSSFNIDAAQNANHQEWMSGSCDHFVASSEYDFEAGSNQELSLKKGQRIRLAPSRLQPPVKGWVLASNGNKIGLVPTNYINILGKKTGAAAANDVSQPQSVPIPDFPFVPSTPKSLGNGTRAAVTPYDLATDKDDGDGTLSETETIVAPENNDDSINEAEEPAFES